MKATQLEFIDYFLDKVIKDPNMAPETEQEISKIVDVLHVTRPSKRGFRKQVQVRAHLRGIP